MGLIIVNLMVQVVNVSDDPECNIIHDAIHDTSLLLDEYQTDYLSCKCRYALH
eukprot:CAMPEP_0116873524 /NCGR_PEP_ID=MMETSP0463-20121206/4701_1 /TAXON_ID=181622 /ORGANISM="Strombidinopsis sp, Strain SopsisLIS2011" /LENGTH=52 /DNA_ID=CAMNT_0004515685 /DNA_START=222 /DNA_END=380 /DNA_ORIENTATION=-